MLTRSTDATKALKAGDELFMDCEPRKRLSRVRASSLISLSPFADGVKYHETWRSGDGA